MTANDPASQDGLTAALVGDCIPSRPLAQLAERDRRFGSVVEILRRAEATVGNLETPILDVGLQGAAPWGAPDDWVVRASPPVAADLRALGFDAFARANNHGMDWGVEGMRETSRLLDSVGLVHAGAGESASAARAPAYLETPGGRVALISATTSPSPDVVAPALDPFHGVAARPGVHAVRVRATVTADPTHIAWLRELRLEFPELSSAWTEAEPDLEVAGTRFIAGDEHGVAYEVDPDDLRELLRSVRQGKQHAEVAVLALHVHQGDRPGELPPSFLRELARTAIDVGADAVVVSGPHRLGPVEVHRGRPIFYGLGNFIWSDLHEPQPRYFWERTDRSLGDAAPDPAVATDAELMRVLNADAFDAPEVFRAVIAMVRFEAGGVAEVRLHPVELGYGEPLTRSGIPRTATPEVAAEVLSTMAELSSSFACEVLPDGGVVTAGR